MKTQISFTLVCTLICCWPAPAAAEYTLILKNGRRITVQNYREEKGVIKFSGLGGEIGISKEQIQAIRQGDAAASGDLDLTRSDSPTRAAAGIPTPAQEGSGAKPLTPEEERAKEEQEYQKKIGNLTDQLKAARDRYSEEIRGTTSPEPTQLITEEQIKARQEDLVSRFKEAQNNPSPPASVILSRPSPFTTLPPTQETVPGAAVPPPPDLPQVLTEKERELSELRQRAIQLENERERLINEMRQKNLNTGSLLVE
jgi:hypothetical protein